MAKTVKTIREWTNYFTSIRVYRDEIEWLQAQLGNGKLEVENVRYDFVEELRADFGDHITDLEVNGDLGSVYFTRNGGGAFVHDEPTFWRVKDRLDNCQSFWNRHLIAFCIIFTFISFPLTFFTLSTKSAAWFGPGIALIFVLYLIGGMVIYSAIHNKVSLLRRYEVRDLAFWNQHKSTMITVVITALIGGSLGFVGERILSFVEQLDTPVAKDAASQPATTVPQEVQNSGTAAPANLSE